MRNANQKQSCRSFSNVPRVKCEAKGNYKTSLHQKPTIKRPQKPKKYKNEKNKREKKKLNGTNSKYENKTERKQKTTLITLP